MGGGGDERYNMTGLQVDELAQKPNLGSLKHFKIKIRFIAFVGTYSKIDRFPGNIFPGEWCK